MKRLLIALLLLNLIYFVSHRFSDSEPLEAEQVALVTGQTMTLPVFAGPQAPDPSVFSHKKSQKKSQSKAELPESPEPEAEPSDCLVLGPFNVLSGASRAVELVDEYVQAAEIEDRDSALLPDYMVYVGPESGPKSAQSKAREFSEKGMDTQVISSGTLANALSLGVFSRKNLADGLQDSLEASGHDAKVRVFDRNRKGFQVAGAFNSGVRDLLRSRDVPYVECPTPSV